MNSSLALTRYCQAALYKCMAEITDGRPNLQELLGCGVPTLQEGLTRAHVDAQRPQSEGVGIRK